MITKFLKKKKQWDGIKTILFLLGETIATNKIILGMNIHTKFTLKKEGFYLPHLKSSTSIFGLTIKYTFKHLNIYI